MSKFKVGDRVAVYSGTQRIIGIVFQVCIKVPEVGETFIVQSGTSHENNFDARIYNEMQCRHIDENDNDVDIEEFQYTVNPNDAITLKGAWARIDKLEAQLRKLPYEQV